MKRVFRPPPGSEQSFLEFVRLLKFDERFIVGGAVAENTVKRQAEVESFLVVSAGVQLTDNNRRCKMVSRDSWQCVFGTLTYSTGTHRIRLKLNRSINKNNILMGVCSQNRLPPGPQFYDKPTTHGWFIHGYVIKNGVGSHSGWPKVNENDIIQLTINCDARSLTIRNENNRAESSLQVNINEAPFPWCLLLVMNCISDEVSLL